MTSEQKVKPSDDSAKQCQLIYARTKAAHLASGLSEDDAALGAMKSALGWYSRGLLVASEGMAKAMAGASAFYTKKEKL